MACPPDWQDKSMLILSAAAAGASGVTPNMVVMRDVLPPDLPHEPLACMTALIDRQVAQMVEQLAGFREISRRVEGPDARMAEVKVNWHNAQAKITQGVTFVRDGADALMIATATAGQSEYEDAEPTFRGMLKSFRIG